MVVMYVENWAAALSWYQEKLGLAAVYVEEDHRFAVLGFPDGGPVLHVVGTTDRMHEGRSRCAPNIGVVDFDAAVAELRGRDVPVLSVQHDEDGYRLATIADPEGNQLNLYVFTTAPSPA
jgi:catechol 2,3-dioxygenase-like lactoylglutathione lyase family enzyme